MIPPDGLETRIEIKPHLRLSRPNTTSLNLLGQKFDDATVEMLLKLKKANPTLLTVCGIKPDETEAAFTAQGLTPQDAKLLAPEIAVHGSLTEINLLGNNMKEEGGAAIAEALMTNRSLTTLKSNFLGLKGAKVMGEVLKVNNILKILEAPNNGIDVEGAKAIANGLAVNGSLTKLSLARNNLGADGTKSICDALKENKTLKELDLHGEPFGSSNIGGAAGAKHVADMLRVNGSLSSINLFGHNLSSEGAAAVLAIFDLA